MRWGLFLLGASLLFVGISASIAEDEEGHFHHVHLNVTDPQKTIQFYTTYFGATQIKFNGVADALFTERSFILLNKVSSPPASELKSGIWHIGWGGVDVANEYEWLKKKGVSFHTPLTPLTGPDNYYMYISGPDKELIEINTMGHHRFGHVHMFANDVNATCAWYADNLGIPLRVRERPKPADMIAARQLWMNSFRADNVQIIVFGKPELDPSPYWWPDPPLKTLAPTKSRAIDHIAFSYRNIGSVFERMKKAGLKIVEPIAVREDYKLKSFFVLGPNDVLIEIVESKPIPDGIWEK